MQLRALWIQYEINEDPRISLERSGAAGQAHHKWPCVIIVTQKKNRFINSKNNNNNKNNSNNNNKQDNIHNSDQNNDAQSDGAKHVAQLNWNNPPIA